MSHLVTLSNPGAGRGVQGASLHCHSRDPQLLASSTRGPPVPRHRPLCLGALLLEVTMGPVAEWALQQHALPTSY